jgi:hypothetical protein
LDFEFVLFGWNCIGFGLLGEGFVGKVGVLWTDFACSVFFFLLFFSPPCLQDTVELYAAFPPASKAWLKLKGVGAHAHEEVPGDLLQPLKLFFNGFGYEWKWSHLFFFFFFFFSPSWLIEFAFYCGVWRQSQFSEPFPEQVGVRVLAAADPRRAGEHAAPGRMPVDHHGHRLIRAERHKAKHEGARDPETNTEREGKKSTSAEKATVYGHARGGRKRWNADKKETGRDDILVIISTQQETSWKTNKAIPQTKTKNNAHCQCAESGREKDLFRGRSAGLGGANARRRCLGRLFPKPRPRQQYPRPRKHPQIVFFFLSLDWFLHTCARQLVHFSIQGSFQPQGVANGVRSWSLFDQKAITENNK